MATTTTNVHASMPHTFWNLFLFEHKLRPPTLTWDAQTQKLPTHNRHRHTIESPLKSEWSIPDSEGLSTKDAQQYTIRHSLSIFLHFFLTQKAKIRRELKCWSKILVNCVLHSLPKFWTQIVIRALVSQKGPKKKKQAKIWNYFLYKNFTNASLIHNLNFIS